MTSASESTDILHKKIMTLTDKYFPWKNHKISSTNKPWITDSIRRKIRRKDRAFKKNKKCERWRTIANEVSEDIIRKKKEYYDNEAEKIKSAGSGRIPFGILTHVSEPDEPPAWNVTQMRPGASEAEIAEELADYFVQITPAIPENTPLTYQSPFNAIEPHQVAERFRLSKKPKCAVVEDPLPCVINSTADLLAIPATRIMNIALATLQWPKAWKVETQSAIPKTTCPKSFSEVRNISCTNFISKILESFVLDKLKEEIHLKYN